MNLHENQFQPPHMQKEKKKKKKLSKHEILEINMSYNMYEYTCEN